MLMLVGPLYMLQVYDRVLMSGSVPTLLALTWLIVGLMAVMGILEWVRSMVLIRVGARMDGLLSLRLFNATLDYAATRPNANTQPIRDLDAVRQFMTGNGLFVFFDAPWMPVYLLVLYLFHPLLGLLATVGGLILIVLALVNERATKKLLTEASAESMKENQYIGSNLRNLEVIDALGMRDRILRRWLGFHEKVMGLQAKASDRAAAVTATSKTFRLLLQSLMLGLGAWLAIDQIITPGVMIAASILMGRALAPVDQMIGVWKQFVGARGSYERLNDLLTKIPAKPRTMTLPAPKGTLSAEAAVVAPPGAKLPSLRGVSFHISAGECIGVIGPSAAGKSSLARALLGVWPAAAGKMRLDGADITQWNRDELGPHIGYLPQDVELFEGTVAENIARFGELDAAKIVAAAQMAGVHEMILKLPQGYETPLGEGGASLSGGQRQRVGLARALYAEPKVVVLDEPNSNLDDVGEAALAQAVAAMRAKGTTLVLITHRPSILAQVDRIMVLREGLIDMFAPRDEVLAKFVRPAAPTQPALAKPTAS
jgi:ATP-binding cassette subfamily C protein EexD